METPKPKINYAILEYARVDYATLKLLLFAFDNIPEMDAIKFCQNNFSEREARCIFDWAANANTKKIQKFFWDWNPLAPDLQASLVPQLGIAKIQFLMLRSCQLDDKSIKILCQNI